MINFKRVQQSLCDLFTKVYSGTKCIKDIDNLTLSYPYLANKRFNVVSYDYWSSTTDVSNTSNAWNVNFLGGNDNWDDKSYTYYVRCVRLSDNDVKFYHV